MRVSDRLSWMLLGLALGASHCATAVQEDVGPVKGGTSGFPLPMTGGAQSTTGGTSGPAPQGGVFNGQPTAGTGMVPATGGRSSGGATGGRGGGSSSTGGKTAQGGSGIFGGGAEPEGGAAGEAGGGAVPKGDGGAGGSEGPGSEGGSGGSVAPADPCDNGKRDGFETDVDCGGKACDPCEEGDACKADGDCVSEQCRDLECTPEHCADGDTNEDESDEDCGGSCALCDVGQACASDDDCEAGSCVDDECAEPSHCVYGWRDDPCGEQCLSVTQADQAACAEVLDCYIDNDCGPGDACVSVTGPCGQNEIQEGTAPYPVADDVYECLCE